MESVPQRKFRIEDDEERVLWLIVAENSCQIRFYREESTKPAIEMKRVGTWVQDLFGQSKYVFTRDERTLLTIAKTFSERSLIEIDDRSHTLVWKYKRERAEGTVDNAHLSLNAGGDPYWLVGQVETSVDLDPTPFFCNPDV